MITKMLKKRSKMHTEQFTCRVPPELKELEFELKKLDWDVPELARMTLKKAFEDALNLADKASEITA